MKPHVQDADEGAQHCERPWACEKSPLRPDSGAVRLESCVPGDAEALDFERALPPLAVTTPHFAEEARGLAKSAAIVSRLLRLGGRR